LGHGGFVVEGTPEDVYRIDGSYTGQYLRGKLSRLAEAKIA
jgi:excinuclease UvrABC ATPase subunit